jgi:hypothetical protein
MLNYSQQCQVADLASDTLCLKQAVYLGIKLAKHVSAGVGSQYRSME